MNRKLGITLLAGIALTGGILAFTSGNKKYPPLSTVPYVDLNRYMGEWYEISSFPQSFQKDCNCSRATYRLNPKGYVEVLNECRKGTKIGRLDQVRGKALPVKNSNNSKLKVQFFWPFKGDYWIIDLASDYSYAIVGDPSRKYLWILSRQPSMNDDTYNKLLDLVKLKGFDITKLNKTEQGCD